MTYTFITTYRGGTYIEQVPAPDIMEATFRWAERVANDPDIQGLDGAAFRRAFENDIEEFPPALIDGCPNVWHLFFFSGRNRMDVHIVGTSEIQEPVLSQAQPMLVAAA
ncbi:MAG: hypothetical protein ACKVUS_12555 [Saprospiraceae bacterium]